MNIPMVDLKIQYNKYKEEFDKAVVSVMESTAFIMGPEVSAFEKDFAQYLGSSNALAVASGTDALLIAMLALGIKEGDEVIVPDFTFIATSEAVSRTGATPVFADVEPDTFCIDISDAQSKITSRTKAIVPVHLYGQCADMDKVSSFAKQHNLFVIEDCAQSTGATWKGKKAGTIGDMGCFSFFPSKNLGAYGDGGMIVTENAEAAEKIKALRNHGSFERYYHVLHGFNSRLDSMQAAILRVKLMHLDEWNKMRRDAAGRYAEGLSGTSFRPPFERPVSESLHVYHQYTVKVPSKRNELQKFLAEKGISSMIYYPVSLHRQEVYRGSGFDQGNFPVSQELEEQVISLPIYPELTKEQTDYVIAALKEFEKSEY